MTSSGGTASNVTFIGPTAEQIRVMGNKASARKTMMEVGVPIVPGTPSRGGRPSSARRRTSASPVSRPTGLAPARQSLMPL